MSGLNDACCRLTRDRHANRRPLFGRSGTRTKYTYDDADELTALSYDLGSSHIGDLAYTYDLAGRRISQSGSLSSLSIPNTVASATYDLANRLTSWGGASLTYDNNGNLTTYGSSTYSWNVRNQLTGTSDGTGVFTYDAFGRRTSQTVSGTTVPYLYDGANPATVAGNLMLAGLNLDEFYGQVGTGATTSYLTDALGSTTALTDGSGSVSGSFTYGPYGLASQSGSATTPFQYTGRENDGATGLYYYRARYYHPGLGRFISQDPIGLDGGVNVYTYAAGNPVSNIDSLGLLPDTALCVGMTANGCGSMASTMMEPPDYLQFQLDAYVFSLSATYTAYGDIFQGKGVSRLYPSPLSAGVSISVGWLLSPSQSPLNLCGNQPSRRRQLNNFLNGWSASGGGYAGYGGSVAVNGSGSALNLGVGAGGIGFSPGIINTYEGNLFGNQAP